MPKNCLTFRQLSSERGWLLDPRLRVRWLAASSKNTKVTRQVAAATSEGSLSQTYLFRQAFYRPESGIVPKTTALTKFIDKHVMPEEADSPDPDNPNKDDQWDEDQPSESSEVPMLPKIIKFDTLARCGDEIWIEHNGQIYRLRKTRQDKLILTK